MISLITGLPGNGKTLYALSWLIERAAKEGRQVYYNGIADLRVPGWIECPDPEKWAEIPTGSILVIDEAQRVFRPRMHGRDVPGFVAQLETHRHLGVDLVFITQHPMLIDANVRRLCGQHFHVIRKFGTHFATIHEWGACKETCDKSRDDSVRHEWRYPKENFALYKSADAHTHKARLPFKVWLLLLMPLILGALAWWAWSRIDPNKGAAPVTSGALAVGGSSSSGKVAASLSPADYVAAHVPRVAGLPHTAPVYDTVTAVVVAPYPAACVRMGTRCSCYSQQGTVLVVSGDVCGQIVERGFFVSWQQPPPSTQLPIDKRIQPGAPEGGLQAPGYGGAAPMSPVGSGRASGEAPRRSLVGGRSAEALPL